MAISPPSLHSTTPQADWFFGLVLRILNDRETAEEVLLDIYTQVWRQAASYDHQRGTPLAWLMTIARSRALDRLRSGCKTGSAKNRWMPSAKRAPRRPIPKR